MNRLSLNPSQCNIFTKPVSRILCLHCSKYCYLWCEMTVMQDKVVSIPTKEHPPALYLLYWEKNTRLYFSMLLYFCVLASLLNRKRKCTTLWWGNSKSMHTKALTCTKHTDVWPWIELKDERRSHQSKYRHFLCDKVGHFLKTHHCRNRVNPHLFAIQVTLTTG